MDGSTQAQLHTTVQPLDGPLWRAALRASATWLETHAEAINALNVFPVPDGDTGLNLSLTLRSAVDAVPDPPPTAIGEVASAAARGALMGARGNSGVILAEYLRALARSLEGLEAANASELAGALEAASQAAYAAVPRPVEGTILTVAREAAAAARRAASESGDVMTLLEAAHTAAQEAVARTPEQLDILRRASVVDAGGEGLRVWLEGILRHLRGESVDLGPARVEMRADLEALHGEGDDQFGFCTEILLQGSRVDLSHVRAQLEQLGTCVLVVGDQQLLKLHVHTLHPGDVLNLATGWGEMARIKIDNMQVQHETFAGNGAATVPPRAPAGPAQRVFRTDRKVREPGTSLVAVTIGAGFTELFESLGAVAVRCERTLNPSVEQIVAAIDATPREEVIIAPNDRNALLAAEQAARLRPERTIWILPTDSLPRGVAAAVGLNPDAAADENLHRLRAAMERCHTIELTRAVRSALLDDVTVGEGALLAFLDGRFVATAGTFGELTAAALERLPDRPYEIATIYPGEDAAPAETQRLAERIRRQQGIEVTVEPGGQPHYYYVIGVE